LTIDSKLGCFDVVAQKVVFKIRSIVDENVEAFSYGVYLAQYSLALVSDGKFAERPDRRAAAFPDFATEASAVRFAVSSGSYLLSQQAGRRRRIARMHPFSAGVRDLKTSAAAKPGSRAGASSKS
jgi:hypothetical protein